MKAEESFEFKLEEDNTETNRIFRETGVEFAATYFKKFKNPRRDAANFNAAATQKLRQLIESSDVIGTFNEGPARKAFAAGAAFVLKLNGGTPWE
jgi:hypothetical protein